MKREMSLPLDDHEAVSAVVDAPDGCRPHHTPGLVLAHGANNDLQHPLLASVAEGLARNGAASTLRFNFRYRERGVKSPDRQEVLEDTFRRAHDALRDNETCPPGAVFLGGKSLGARVAASLASRGHEAEGLPTDGLIFLGYPLHAPGRKDRLRLQPLRGLDVPTLFIQGSRDPFCDLDLLRDVLQTMDHPPVLHVIEGGGHGFEVPEADGRSAEAVYDEVLLQVERFIERVAG